MTAPLMMERYFKYLDELRKSAVTNMFGAAPYLSEAFGLSLSEARTILRKWMDSDLERPMSDRVAAAAKSDEHR